MISKWIIIVQFQSCSSLSYFLKALKGSRRFSLLPLGNVIHHSSNNERCTFFVKPPSKTLLSPPSLIGTTESWRIGSKVDTQEKSSHFFVCVHFKLDRNLHDLQFFFSFLCGALASEWAGYGEIIDYLSNRFGGRKFRSLTHSTLLSESHGRSRILSAFFNSDSVDI